MLHMYSCHCQEAGARIFKIISARSRAGFAWFPRSAWEPTSLPLRSMIEDAERPVLAFHAERGNKNVLLQAPQVRDQIPQLVIGHRVLQAGGHDGNRAGLHLLDIGG